MRIARMRLFDSSTGNTKAFIDLATEEGIVIKGFKLVQGPTGLFVGAPSEKGKDGKWYESVIIPKELKEDLNSMAQREYHKLAAGSQEMPHHEEEGSDLPF